MVNNLSNYMLFLQKYGCSLAEINPGSDEIALQTRDALQAIELLQESNTPILDSDVLKDEAGKLAYTYENWYCDKLGSDTQKEFVSRSCSAAKDYISSLAGNGHSDRYIVFVL